MVGFDVKTVDLLTTLKEIYKEYDVKIEKKEDYVSFIIINPASDDNIEVVIENYCDGFELTFIFSFYHTHFDEDIDGLINYINDFIQGKVVVYAIYCEERMVVANSTYKKNIDISSGESIISCLAGDEIMFEQYGEDISYYDWLFNKLKGFNSRCSLCEWDSTKNKDISFTI